jgi:integrase/recombinase XerD
MFRRSWPVVCGEGGALVSVLVPCLVRSVDRSGGVVVRLGVELLDVYLEFLAGRCRPNTVLAVGYDLKVFFAVVGKPVERVQPADVLGFITA